MAAYWLYNNRVTIYDVLERGTCFGGAADWILRHGGAIAGNPEDYAINEILVAANGNGHGDGRGSGLVGGYGIGDYGNGYVGYGCGYGYYDRGGGRGDEYGNGGDDYEHGQGLAYGYGYGNGGYGIGDGRGDGRGDGVYGI